MNKIEKFAKERQTDFVCPYCRFVINKNHTVIDINPYIGRSRRSALGINHISIAEFFYDYYWKYVIFLFCLIILIFSFVIFLTLYTGF